MAISRKGIRITLITLLLLPIVLVVLVPVLLYLPPVQRFAVKQATAALERATGMKASVGNLRLRFPLDLQIQDVLLLTQAGDTMAVLGNMQTAVSLRPVLDGRVETDRLLVEDLKLYAFLDSLQQSNIAAQATRLEMGNVSADLNAQQVHVGSVGVENGFFNYVSTDTVPNPDPKPVKWTIDINRADIRNFASLIRLPLNNVYTGAHIRMGLVDDLSIALEEFTLDIGQGRLDLYSGGFATHQEPNRAHYVDYTAMAYTNVVGVIQKFHLKGSSLSLHAQDMSLDEVSGARVDCFTGDIALQDQLFTGEDMYIKTPLSELTGSIRLPLDIFAQEPNTAARFKANFTGTLSLQDLYYFTTIDPVNIDPAARRVALSSVPPATVDLNVSGTLDRAVVEPSSLSLPNTLQLHLHGSAGNITREVSREGTLNIDLTTAPELNRWLAHYAPGLSGRVVLPNATHLVSTLNLKGNQAATQTKLTAAGGVVNLDAAYNLASSAFRADLQTAHLNLMHILPQDSVGRVDIALQAQANGLDFLSPNANAQLHLFVDSAQYKSIRIGGGLTLDGSLENEQLVASLNSNIPGADLSAQVDALIRNRTIDGSLLLQANELDARQLGLTPDTLRGAFTVEGTVFSDLSQTHRIDSQMRNVDMAWGSDSLRFEELLLRAGISPTSVQATVASGDLNVEAYCESGLSPLLASVSALTQVAGHFVKDSIGEIPLSVPIKLLPHLAIEAQMGTQNPLYQVLRRNKLALQQASVSLHTDSLSGLSGHILSTGLRMDTTRIDRAELTLSTSFRTRSQAEITARRLSERLEAVSSRAVLADKLIQDLVQTDAPQQPNAKARGAKLQTRGAKPGSTSGKFTAQAGTLSLPAQNTNSPSKDADSPARDADSPAEKANRSSDTFKDGSQAAGSRAAETSGSSKHDYPAGQEEVNPLLHINLSVQKERYRGQAPFDIRLKADTDLRSADVEASYANEQGVQYAVAATGYYNTEGFGLAFDETKPLFVAGQELRVNDNNSLFYFSKLKDIYADLHLEGFNGAQLEISSATDDPNVEQINLLVKKLQLANVAPLLGMESLDGLTFADVLVEREDGVIRASGDVSVNDFFFGGNRIGNIGLALFYEPRDNSSHYVTAQLNYNGDLALSADGQYHAADKDSPIDMHAVFERFPLEVLNPILGEDMASLQGFLQGSLAISGTPQNIRLDGTPHLEDAKIFSPQLGNTFVLDSKPLNFEQSKLRFDDFTLRVEGRNEPVYVNGHLFVLGPRAMQADLHVTAQEVHLVDSSYKRGQMLYGKLLASADLTMKGALTAPTIRGSVGILGGTDITYVYTQAAVEASDRMAGVVEFKDFSDTLFTAAPEPVAQTFRGMDIAVSAQIDPAVRVGVDLSANHQDYVKLSGGGSVRFTLPRFGEMSLIGNYDPEGGEVNYTFPVVGKKSFTIDPASMITWNGNPLNPYIDFKAHQAVRANVADESGESRKVDFDVSIVARETLENLDLRFALAAPEDMQVQNQISAMSAEEQGKQAVALMVSGTFLAAGNNQKISMESVLSNLAVNELNALTGKLLSGTDLNVGMELHNGLGGTSSYTDYTYSFSRRFLNDRIRFVLGGKVSAGNLPTNYEQTFIDNVSLEYRIDKAGLQYVTLFHKRNSDNLLEGVITETGLGYVIKTKFRSLADLFLQFKPKRKSAPKTPQGAAPTPGADTLQTAP